MGCSAWAKWGLLTRDKDADQGLGQALQLDWRLSKKLL
jgi:hypothetical protein